MMNLRRYTISLLLVLDKHMQVPTAAFLPWPKSHSDIDQKQPNLAVRLKPNSAMGSSSSAPSVAAAAARMKTELDSTKAAAGNRKHLAMLERLSKCTATPSADSPEASPVAAFLSRFSAAKVVSESALSACHSSPDDIPTSLATASSAVDDIERLIAEASHSLPPYELRSALTVVSDFRASHKVAASEIQPKKTFSFRIQEQEQNHQESPARSSCPVPAAYRATKA